LNGAQAGPFAKDELVARIASGEVTRDSLVWRDQMAGWAPASQVPDVAALFGVVPPPLPAQ
jgi:GYF domain 2